MAKKPALTPKQKLFVANYLSNGFNATKAARDAGYAEKSAQIIGFENLTKPIISEQIKKGAEKALQDVEVDRIKWLHEVKKIAFSDMRKVAKFDPDGVRFEDSENLDDDTAGAVEAIESTTTYDKQGNAIVTRKVKLYSKTKGLDTLGKFLGMLKEKIELTGEDGGPIVTQMLEAKEAEEFRKRFEELHPTLAKPNPKE